MDFLMLMPHGIRILLEVDGQPHRARDDRPAPEFYAKMVTADRDLQLNGYRTVRFGAHELQDEQNPEPMIERFFRRLYGQFGLDC